MSIREYAGAAKRTTLVGDITAASATLTVTDATGYPTGASGPFAIAFQLGVAAEEKVLIQSRSGNTLTVATGGRGYDGTSASAHSSGSTVDHVLTAIDIREANAFVNGGGVTTAGGSTITASGAAVKPLVVKGAASQTANLLEAQSNAGAVLTAVSSSGDIAVATGSLAVGSATPFAYGGRVEITATTATHRGLVVRGAASQSASLAEFQNSSGTVLASISAAGAVVISGGAGLDISNRFAAEGTVPTSSDTNVQLYAAPTGGLRRVVVGALDSGGAGFRLLRIAN